MPGLIPLMLKPAAAGSRNSVVYPANTSVQPLKLNSPQQQSASETSQMTTSQLPKPKPFKRQSQLLPMLLPSLPYTPGEWAKAVFDVKRQYINRQYRPCSVRCGEILDNIKDQSTVEPAYLIYLNFYAANSLEMLARPLQPSSPYRSRLLQQSRDRYVRASELIQMADETIGRSSRSSSAASSSLHSPAGSVSSTSWTNSSNMSSPTPSICSLEDAVMKLSQPAPVKKRVTFMDFPEEPIIRPDSPTLGFDDFYLGSRSPEPKYLPPLPELPEPAEEVKPIEVDDVEQECEDPFSFLRESSIHRYCGLLSGLRSQITAHVVSIDAELFATPTVDLAAARANRAADEEMRNLEIRARIERLRQNGWQRRRFDARRYEELRENVLAELTY